MLEFRDTEGADMRDPKNGSGWMSGAGQVWGSSPVVYLGVREVFGIRVDLVYLALQWQLWLTSGDGLGACVTDVGCGWSQEWILNLSSHRW